MTSRLSIALLPLLLAAGLSSCITQSHATEFNGTSGIRGVPVEYQTTTSYSLRGLFIFELSGNSSKARTIDAFTEEAAARGATRVRITQTSNTIYWFILPPLSFFIHPSVTTVEGDVEGSAAQS